MGRMNSDNRGNHLRPGLSAPIQASGIRREVKIIHILPESACAKSRTSRSGSVVANHVVIRDLRRRVTTRQSARADRGSVRVRPNSKNVELQTSTIDAGRTKARKQIVPVGGDVRSRNRREALSGYVCICSRILLEYLSGLECRNT